MPTTIDGPFSVDELLLIRHLLVVADGYSSGYDNVLRDETLKILDVKERRQAVAIRDSALAKVRALLGSKRPVVATGEVK